MAGGWGEERKARGQGLVGVEKRVMGVGVVILETEGGGVPPSLRRSRSALLVASPSLPTSSPSPPVTLPHTHKLPSTYTTNNPNVNTLNTGNQKGIWSSWTWNDQQEGRAVQLDQP